MTNEEKKGQLRGLMLRLLNNALAEKGAEKFHFITVAEAEQRVARLRAEGRLPTFEQYERAGRAATKVIPFRKPRRRFRDWRQMNLLEVENR